MLALLIVIGVGLAIFAVTIWAVRGLARPVPPAPDPHEVQEVSAEYRCTVCGLRLTVTHAQDEEHTAPRHCREPMVEMSVS